MLYIDRPSTLTRPCLRANIQLSPAFKLRDYRTLRHIALFVSQKKLQVDAAINQLKLRHLRGRARNLARIEALRNDERVKREISEARQHIVVLEEDMQKLHDVHQDLQAQHDALCAREKTMARRLPQEFPSSSKSHIELLEIQYKRRPKVSLKNVAVYDLISLGRYLTSYAKPTYLPIACANYVRILESLDTRPVTLPKSVHTIHWNHLVQTRRQKIELELRIQARQLEVTATEETIADFSGKIDASKSRVDHLSSKLKRMRDERVTREQDTELQLVLKRGQVEVDLYGERRDMLDAVMVPCLEIEKVNEHILAMGSRKLDALKRDIDLHHSTLSFEWEHRCLKTRFRELQEDLHYLRDVTATKDMQTYLKRVAKKWRDDKSAIRLQREIETTMKSLEKTLAAEMNKLEKTRAKITFVKKKNAALDQNITEMNVARWEMEYERDLAMEARQREHMDRKMQLYKRRSDLVRKIQDNYTELLALQTEHELLRLRTYPALELFETLDDKVSD